MKDLLDEALELAQFGGHPPTMAKMIERLVKYADELRTELKKRDKIRDDLRTTMTY